MAGILSALRQAPQRIAFVTTPTDLNGPTRVSVDLKNVIHTMVMNYIWKANDLKENLLTNQ